MQIRVYLTEGFRNEESPIFRAKNERGIFTKNLDKSTETTLEKLYAEGWTIKAVTMGAGTASAVQMFYMEHP